ncbi:MAG: hypothetical protein JO158_05570 [Gammaproteobacteria bacterium]|nr:hypothetical protein [Gammaproteobacteria bacterium]
MSLRVLVGVLMMWVLAAAVLAQESASAEGGPAGPAAGKAAPSAPPSAAQVAQLCRIDIKGDKKE